MPLVNDPPPPEGWVHIEHPDHGRSPNPVSKESLGAWAKSGWSEVSKVIAVPPTPPAAAKAQAPKE